MKLSAVEQQALTPECPLSQYTDEELEQMSWRQLERLSQCHFDTIRYRVTKASLSRREACALSPQQGPTIRSRLAG